MKKSILFLVITVLTLFSCADPGGDPIFDGFSFSFYEFTGEGYDIEVVIGGMDNGIFKPTDSVKMGAKIPSLARGETYLYSNERWKPDLDKIRTIPSSHCYFKIKLSNDRGNRTEMIGGYNQQELMKLLLPSGDAFVGEYGRLVILIRKNEIIGKAESIL